MEKETESVSGYRFQKADLRIGERKPGISAFMRIKNGADWLETSIRSHMKFFDEIVAVYNQCTDATPEILARLQRELGRQRLRVIHYVDSVFPPGSDGHARTAPDSPQSLVNYYNFALASTRFQYATKLDDDHLAIVETTKSVTDLIRSGSARPDTMYCFSGLNLFQGEDRRLGILRNDPVSGGGDIGFFRVTPETCFAHDRRFERFRRGSMKRCFAGFLYWHLKYLKSDMGFGNYELEKNPLSRYARRQAALKDTSGLSMNLPELAVQCQPGVLRRLQAIVSGKSMLLCARDAAIASAFPDRTVEDAIIRTTHPEFRTGVVPV